MPRTTKILCLSLPPNMLKKAERLAKAENRTKSELFREALRYYMEDRRWEKLQRGLAKRAGELGIKNEADVEKIIDEIRK